MVGLSFGAAFGMSVPLIQALSGEKPKAVVETTYNQNMFWLYIPIMLAMAIAPHLSWKKISLKEVWIRIANPLATAIFLTGCLLIWSKWGPGGLAADPEAKLTLMTGWVVNRAGWTVFVTSFALFALTSNLWKIVEMLPRSKRGIGGEFAHIRLAFTMIGLICSRGLEQTVFTTASLAEPGTAFGYTMTYKGPTEDFAQRNNEVLIETTKRGKTDVITPGLYYIFRPDQPLQSIKWPGIRRGPLFDLYLATGEIEKQLYEEIRLPKDGVANNTDRGFSIRYIGYTMEGNMGSEGAKFIAEVELIRDGEEPETLFPAVAITDGRLIPEPVQIDENLELVMNKLSVDDGSAFFQFDAVHPFIPIQVFYKPLVWLVWLGIGIMTLGGLIASRFRRNPVKSEAEDGA
jgi:cytochrome c biogenesis factor